MQHAHRIEHALDRLGTGVEGVGDALVGDEQRTAGAQQRPAPGERVDRSTHVVQRLEHRDEIESGCLDADAARRLRDPGARDRGRGADRRLVAGVAVHERDAVGDPCLAGVAARLDDRRLVEVEPDDAGVRERVRERDGRPADTAAGIEHGASGVERGGPVGQRVDPAAQLVGEARAVQRAESAAQFGAVLVERDAAALAVVGDELGEREGDAGEQARRGRDMRRVGLVDEHRGVQLGQHEAALVPEHSGLDDREVAGGSLLFEPLTGVARRDSRGVGERGGGHRAGLVQRAVEAEAAAELDREQLGGRAEHADDLLGERADLFGRLLLC